MAQDAFIVTLIAVSALATYWLTLVAEEAAFLCGAVDWPGPRKIHQQPIPRWGGLAVAVPVVGTLIYTDWRLLLATLLVVVIGAWDDCRSLSAYPKLLMQTMAAVLVSDDWLSVLWIVGLTNAWNLVDGVDGLGAGLGVVAAGAVVLLAADDVQLVPVLTLLGALVGFLPHNWHPARIFLGDSGAYFIGFLIAVATLALPWPARVAICFVPVADTALAVLRRGLRWAQPDQAHLHHALLRNGLTPRQVCAVLYAVAVLWAWSIQ